jgi:hypothetical protein
VFTDADEHQASSCPPATGGSRRARSGQKKIEVTRRRHHMRRRDTKFECRRFEVSALSLKLEAQTTASVKGHAGRRSMVPVCR